MPPLRGLRPFAVGFYKDAAPDGASAAVTNDEAMSPFSDEVPTGDNGGNREGISTLLAACLKKPPLSLVPPVKKRLHCDFSGESGRRSESSHPS